MAVQRVGSRVYDRCIAACAVWPVWVACRSGCTLVSGHVATLSPRVLEMWSVPQGSAFDGGAPAGMRRPGAAVAARDAWRLAARFVTT